MKNTIRSALLVLLAAAPFGLMPGCSERVSDELPAPPTPTVKISVLFNNIPLDSDLTTEWGFSCLVEGLDKTILFDTGRDGEILLGNMEEMGIAPGASDIVILSHYHGDHTNGLARINEENPDVTVFMPRSFPDPFRESVKGFPVRVKDVDTVEELFEGVCSTGEMGESIIEQSLVLDRPDGLIVITGCAHPGIVSILKSAERIYNRKVRFVIGGFHLGGRPDSEILQIIDQFREMGVDSVAPTHCTGDRAMDLFREAYGDRFVDAGCGAVIEV